MNTKLNIIYLALAALFSSAALSSPLTISQTGASAGSTENKYYVRIPSADEEALTITITGGGDTPALEPSELCECGEDTQAPTAITDADGDGTPDDGKVWTFSNDAGTQAGVGPVVTWNVNSSTNPGEYKFNVTKCEQKYVCPDNWTGGPITKTNSESSVEITIVAFKIQCIAQAENPTERKRLHLGVREMADVSILPSFMTAVWSFQAPLSGDHVSTSSETNTVTIETAAQSDASRDLVLRAAIDGSVNADTTLTVYTPISVSMVREGTALLHTVNKAQVGYKAKYKLQPADVSFSRIRVFEGGGLSSGDGKMAYLSGAIHATGTPHSVIDDNIVDAVDEISVYVATCPPFGLGSMGWPIEVWYKGAPSGSGGLEQQFTIAMMTASCDVTKTSISKSTVGPITANHTDPTSIW